MTQANNIRCLGVPFEIQSEKAIGQNQRKKFSFKEFRLKICCYLYLRYGTQILIFYLGSRPRPIANPKFDLHWTPHRTFHRGHHQDVNRQCPIQGQFLELGFEILFFSLIFF